MTENTIKPTIGRRVWYWPSPAELDKTATGNFFPHVHDDSQALDAGIVYVWNDRLVNLAVTDHQGVSQARTMVRLLQEGESATPGQAYAQWMPYQQGQVRKSAAEVVSERYNDSVAVANDWDASTQRLASAKKMVGASASVGSRWTEPTQRDRLEQSLVAGIAGNIGDTPSKAGQIADGIKVVLDALHPLGGEAPKDNATSLVQTVGYADGTAATGVTQLPILSPAEQDLETEIQAKGLTAPRVTPADLQANILHTEIVKHISPSGQVLRWAVLTTRNGFAVAGRPSASASSANDNTEIGERVAIDNAKQELWPLMGYELRSRLAGQ